MFRILFLLLFSINLSGQTTIQPSYFWNFELHPDSIQKKYNLLNLIDSLVKLDNPHDSIKDFLGKQDLELFEAEDPFYIGPIGCSWYCGGGPSKITSKNKTDTLSKSDNIHDFDLKTSWTGNIENNAITFQFKLDTNLNTTKLIIYAGKCSSLKAWKKYARPKEILLTINDSLDLKLNLSDSFDGQGFELRKFLPRDQSLLELKLEVISVYKGTRNDSIFHISEINFDGVGDH